MVEKIVSGAQTGADTGALFGARDAGVATGGWAPRGWRVDGGVAPWLVEFGLMEHASSAYPPRTHANVRDSDATLIFGNPFSRGCELTAKYAETLKRPMVKIRWPVPAAPLEDETSRLMSQHWTLNTQVLHVKLWLETKNVRVLNVAGNRESTNPGIQEACRAFVREVLRG